MSDTKETHLTASSHHVILDSAGNGMPLRVAAEKIFGWLRIAGCRFIERPLANQDYDFFWAAEKDKVAYQVRGSSWDADEPQKRIVVTIIGVGAYANAQALAEKATASGYVVRLAKRIGGRP